MDMIMSRARDLALRIISDWQDAIASRRSDTTLMSVVSRVIHHGQRHDVMTTVGQEGAQGVNPMLLQNHNSIMDRQKTVWVSRGGALY